MSRTPVMLVTAALAVAGLAAATSGGSAATPSGSAPEALTRADALTGAPATDRSARGPAYAARDARVAAAMRAAAVPLPAGGNFNGIRWELAGGDVAASTIEGVLQYNAACQWLRAWNDARDGALAVRVLQSAPSWPAMRGTESGALLATVAAEASEGGGENATAVLADCDASHVREVEYATRLGLTPSR